MYNFYENTIIDHTLYGKVIKQVKSHKYCMKADNKYFTSKFLIERLQDQNLNKYQMSYERKGYGETTIHESSHKKTVVLD